MKKKTSATVMACIMALSLVACSAGAEPDNSGADSSVTEPGNTGAGSTTEADGSTALSILNDVWATYEEDEKFHAMGGDTTNPVDNAPGLFNLEDKEMLQAFLLVPAEEAKRIDEAASLVHSMNTNNFTGAAFHLADGADAETFADIMKGSIKNNQWMCGSPDQYVIYQVKDEYVVTAFGTMDIMKVFKEKFTAVHGENVKILVEENIAG